VTYYDKEYRLWAAQYSPSEHAKIQINDLRSEIADKEAEIARLRATLEVFANPESWETYRQDLGNHAFYMRQLWRDPMRPDGTDTIGDPAEFARKALEGGDE